jgi:signal transduction histidine kinase
VKGVWRARWHGAHGKFRRSLRWRLVGLFLVLALATTVIFLGGMQQVLRGGWQAYVRPLVGHYIDLLAADIGTPPSVARAQALVARLPLAIRIEGPQVQWDSQPERPHRWRRGGGMDDEDDQPGRDSGWWQSRLLADGHRISFGLAGAPGGRFAGNAGWVTLALLLALTALAYAYVRRLLRPLDDIGRGAQRYGRGEFTEPIRVRRADELGELAERINRMAAELHHMLEAKRGLLLAISHELRSPLTRARVNAELVEEGEPQQALLRDLAEMRDLVSDLLESERLATGHAALHTEPSDLSELVQEVIDTHFAGLVQWAPAPKLQLALDRVRLRLLVRNLIDNALRHSAGATTPPAVSAAVQGEAVELTVRDFGPGVADEHLPHLADAFYRADSARQRATGGVGLGLHLCRLVAQAHGGSMAFGNARPGLEVTVRLPVAGPAAAQPAPKLTR